MGLAGRRGGTSLTSGLSKWGRACGFSLLLACAGAACGGPANLDYAYEKEPDPRRGGYKVGPLDVLRINVWKDADLSAEVQVRPDGKITLPLVGEVEVEGKTTEQVRELIVGRMSQFVDGSKAVVTVAVAQPNSYYFTVSGNVAHPGRYVSGAYVTVLEALALAGEPTPYASPQNITILRSERGGKTRKIPVNYDALVSARHLRQNVAIISGDVIVVP